MRRTPEAVPWWLVALASCAGAPAAPRQHLGPVTALAVDRDGNLLSCSQAGVCIGHDWLPVTPGERPLDVAPWRGGLVVVGGEPALRGTLWWHDADLAARGRLPCGDDLLYAVAVRDDGEVAFGGADGVVRVVQLPAMTDGARLLAAHTAVCTDLAYSPDGRWLASAGHDGAVILFDRAGDAVRKLLDHSAAVTCVRFAADGSGLASGAADGKVRLHDTGGRLLRTWQRLGAPVLAICPTEEGWLAGLADGRVMRLQAGREQALLVDQVAGPVTALLLHGGRLWIGGNGLITGAGSTDAPIAPRTSHEPR